jgi:DNA-binding SARP family transcriptional activator
VGAVRDLEQGRVTRPRPRILEQLAGALGLGSGQRADLAAAAAGVAGRSRRPGKGLWLRVLGTVGCWHGSMPVSLGPARQRAVVALLAVHPNTTVHREAIIDALWPDGPPGSAVAVVQSHVSRLRKVLDSGLRGRPGSVVLVSAGTSYRLDVSPDELDLLAFQQLVDRARRAAAPGDLAAACHQFEQALELWQGEPLAGVDVLAGHPAVVGLTQLRASVITEYAQIASGTGLVAKVLPHLRALAEREPLNERAHTQLMICLAASGQQAYALQIYEDLRQRLDNQLGVRPGPELVGTHLRILRQEIPIVATAPGVRAKSPVCAADASVVPEPAGISSFDELTTGLRALLRRSGLSYTQLGLAVAQLPRRSSRATTVPKSTVSDALRTGRVSKPVLLAFLAACDVSDADIMHWLAAWERARTADLDRPAGAQRVLTADAQVLGVHKAIEVDGTDNALPVYILRDVDEGPGGIRHKLQGAARRGGLVVLVGGSSVGKTRSACQAVRDLFPDWWLVHPDPDDPRWPGKLTEARIAPTVVWLDELQRYFEGAHSLTGDQIRALLRADAQIVMIGTLWPERYAAFSAPPVDPLGPDPWRAQREVLQLADVIRVPDRFSDAEYERACRLSAADPRLSAALRCSGYGLTQSIAAAPQLMGRWHDADAYAAAVLNAAIDARRLGVLGPIPASFLRAAAPAYCDNRAQAMAPPEWFESAIDYCTHVLHGAAAALEPVASGMGQVRGYTVAEYLHQHAANERMYLRVPEAARQAALEHIDDDDLVGRLTSALYRLGDSAQAEQVASQALAHVADPDLLMDLHWTLAQCRMRGGRFAESLAALEQALASPGISARHRARLLVLAARTHCQIGEIQKAGQVAGTALRVAQEAGDSWAMGWALHVQTIVTGTLGQLTDALLLFDWALAVPQSDPALTDLRLLLQVNKAIALGSLDRHDEALAAATQACQLARRAGTVIRIVQARGALGQLLFDTGRWAEAMAEVQALPTGAKEPIVACCDLGIAAVICFHRGEIATARRHLAAAAPYAERAGNLLIGSLALARILDRENAGEPGEAFAALIAGFADNAEELDEIEYLLPDAVRLAVSTGDLAAARALTSQAAALAVGSEVPHRQASALYCRGLIEHDPGGLLAAADRYSAANRPLLHAKALEAAAAEFAAAGDHGQAQAAFTRAVEIYTRIGATMDAARLQASFRAHSSPT